MKQRKRQIAALVLAGCVALGSVTTPAAGFSDSGAVGKTQITDLTTEYLSNPIGIDTIPFISVGRWIPTGSVRNRLHTRSGCLLRMMGNMWYGTAEKLRVTSQQVLYVKMYFRKERLISGK